MRIIGFVDSIGRELRLALRGLVRRPAFTFAAIVTLAVGIGATTAIFSVVYSVLIKPLPYPNAHELVRIRHRAPGIDVEDLQASSNMYLTYRRESRTFANVGFLLKELAYLRPPYMRNEELDIHNPKAVGLPHAAVIALGALGFVAAAGIWAPR